MGNILYAKKYENPFGRSYLTILITGAGFVGSQAARILVERGESPVLFDVAPQLNVLASYVDLDKVKIERGDMLSIPDLSRTIREYNIEKIIHTASMLSPSVAKKPYMGVKINIEGFENLLELCRMMDIKKLVFTSTIFVYSFFTKPPVWDRPISEDYPICPPNVYSSTKVACEFLGLNYADWYGVDFVGLRLAGVFGPSQGELVAPPGATMRVFVENPFHGQPVVFEPKSYLPNQPYVADEYVYHKDAGKSTILACDSNRTEHRIFNIGMGKIYTFEQIAQIIKNNLPNAEIRVNTENVRYQHKPLDISRAGEELRYKPDFDMKDAIRDYIATLRRWNIPL